MEKDADVIACRARLNAGEPAELPKPVVAAEVVEKQRKQREVAPEPELPITADPIQFMRGVMNDPAQDPKLRLDAAKALASFTVAKPGEKGKKQQKQEAAEKSATGRFGAAPPPLKRVK